MTEDDKDALLDAVEVLNTYGGAAVLFLEAALARPENSEAQAWMATLWEPEWAGELH